MIEKQTCFSLQELMKLDKAILDSMIFIQLKEEGQKETAEGTDSVYLQMKKTTYSFRGDENTLIHIIDHTKSILYHRVTQDN